MKTAAGWLTLHWDGFCNSSRRKRPQWHRQPASLWEFWTELTPLQSAGSKTHQLLLKACNRVMSLTRWQLCKTKLSGDAGGSKVGKELIRILACWGRRGIFHHGSPLAHQRSSSHPGHLPITTVAQFRAYCRIEIMFFTAIRFCRVMTCI